MRRPWSRRTGSGADDRQGTTDPVRGELEHVGLAAIDVELGTSENELYGRVRACLALPDPGR